MSNGQVVRVDAKIKSENTDEPAQGAPEALREDLRALAAFEYRTALKLCGSCQDYHATFGYGRLAGTKKGMVTDSAALASLLAGYGKPGVRVLIAASADAGLCALTAGVLAQSKPAITIADLCATPLAVCRFFAGMHGFDINTLQLDVAQMPIPGQYDLVLAHNVVSFIPPALHAAFFRNLHDALAGGGTFILGNRVRPRPQDRDDKLAIGKHGRMIEALRTKGIALPEDETVFGKRLEALDRERYERPEGTLDLERMEANFAAAGFAIRERQDDYRQGKYPKAVNPNDRAVTHFFAAQRID